MKADHNYKSQTTNQPNTVSNGSKILKWKQTTTVVYLSVNLAELFPMVQRYLNESRPQHTFRRNHRYRTVSNGSKILKWKQTTTIHERGNLQILLFPMVQRYLNESRPQLRSFLCGSLLTVSNGSKILKWKQTTTGIIKLLHIMKLFPMVQRYLNESRPQLVPHNLLLFSNCFQWFKDT